MTGFGKCETQFANKKITIELRTLNSKNIDLNIRTPHCYRELEAEFRKGINAKLLRGKVDVNVFLDHSGIESATVLNKEVIKAYLTQLSDIYQGDTTELLKMAVRLPDALKTEKEAIGEEETKVFIADAAIEKVNQHRGKRQALKKILCIATQLSDLREGYCT